MWESGKLQHLIWCSLSINIFKFHIENVSGIPHNLKRNSLNLMVFAFFKKEKRLEATGGEITGQHTRTPHVM